MEQSPNVKIISAVIIIILILGLSYVLYTNYKPAVERSPMSDNTKDTSEVVMVENTPMVNGVLSAPTGFPQEIPLESGAIIESATTKYPGGIATQLSASYKSSKTLAQKYTEYKNYMTAAGYQITESGNGSTLKAIFGTDSNVNLSVVISSSIDGTLVQISYLLK